MEGDAVQASIHIALSKILASRRAVAIRCHGGSQMSSIPVLILLVNEGRRDGFFFLLAAAIKRVEEVNRVLGVGLALRRGVINPIPRTTSETM